MIPDRTPHAPDGRAGFFVHRLWLVWVVWPGSMVWLLVASWPRSTTATGGVFLIVLAVTGLISGLHAAHRAAAVCHPVDAVKTTASADPSRDRGAFG